MCPPIRGFSTVLVIYTALIKNNNILPSMCMSFNLCQQKKTSHLVISIIYKMRDRVVSVDKGTSFRRYTCYNTHSNFITDYFENSFLLVFIFSLYFSLSLLLNLLLQNLIHDQYLPRLPKPCTISCPR